jgi:hypothetical protein
LVPSTSSICSSLCGRDVAQTDVLYHWEALAHSCGDGIDRAIAAVDQRIEQTGKPGAAIGEEAKFLALGDELARGSERIGVETDERRTAAQRDDHSALVHSMDRWPPELARCSTLNLEALSRCLNFQTAATPRLCKPSWFARHLDSHLHRPQDRALPTVVRPNERLQRSKLELHVLDAAEARDVDALNARHRARV